FDDLDGLRATLSSSDARPTSFTDVAPAVRLPPESRDISMLTRFASWPIYRGDAVLRRSAALNAHPLNRGSAARINAAEASRLGLHDGCSVRVADVELPCVIDHSVADGTVWLEAANPLTATLPPYGAALTLQKV
ncbi:MAG: NADH-quinone oxidoreductase subunit G, partial [Rhodanobacter sp.]